MVKVESQGRLTVTYPVPSMSSDPLLSGLTVLDFTRVLAGPYCTRLLADLGARVLKVERPVTGDDMRRGYLQVDSERDDQATYFIRINAGKESIALDLGHPGARTVVLDLARTADVAIENFLPGVAARLGCDYATLASARPDIVYCSISGYGQTGPLRNTPAFAHVINAMSGLMHLEKNGEDTPRVAYLQAADVLSGTHAFGAIVAALWRRQRTGRGAYLDVSMLEALVAAEDVSMGSVLNGGDEYPGPRAGMALARVGDRWVAAQIVGSADLWPRVVGLMKRPDLEADPRFSTPLARRQHWAELEPIIVGWLCGFPSAEEAVAALTAARIPCAPVLRPAEVAAHPHLAARRAFPEIPHPARGAVRITASPVHVDGRPLGARGAAPYRPGEHTRAVLRDLLRYDEARIVGLLRERVIDVADGARE